MPTATSRAVYCPSCDCRYAAVPSESGPAVAYEYEPDGFTVSAIRHVCWPRDQRAGRLIEARRAELARLTDALHARQAHPDYEYSVTFPHCADAHTSREGWERNPQADQTPHAIYPAMLGWRRLRAEDVDPATRDPYAYPDGYDAVTDAHGRLNGA